MRILGIALGVALAIACSNVRSATTQWQADEGEWFDSANWDNGIPAETDQAFVNNGGIATAIGLVENASVNVGSLVIASTHGSFDPVQSRSGRVRVVAADACVATSANIGALVVGENDGPIPAGIESRGSFRSFSGDLTIGTQANVGWLSTEIPVDGADILGRVSVGGEYFGSGAFPGTDLLGVGTFSEWGRNLVANSTVVGALEVDKGIRKQGSIVVASAFSEDLGRERDVTVRGELMVSDGGIVFSPGAGQLSIGQATMFSGVTEGLVDVSGPIQGYRLISIGTATGDSTTKVSGTLIARNSFMEVEGAGARLNVGTSSMSTNDGESPQVAGRLELVGSAVKIENTGGVGLHVGAGGTLSFQLAGLTRAAEESIANGISDGYSAIDADSAVLDGRIHADFDFVPARGTHSFDLLVANSLATSMSESDLSVSDLPLGFDVEFFGVTQDDFGRGLVDVIRLTINVTHPIASGDFNHDEVLDLNDIDELTRQSASRENLADFDLNEDLW